MSTVNVDKPYDYDADPVFPVTADTVVRYEDEQDEKDENHDEHHGYPLYVCLGSIAGAKKADVQAVVENLILTQCQTPSLVRYLITRDKANSRWVYEIHEGGDGYSIFHAFDITSEPLYVRLTDNRVVLIEDANAEIVTLTYTDREDLCRLAVDAPSKGKALLPYVSDETALVKAGKVVFGAGVLALLISYGAAFGMSAAMSVGLLPNPYVTSAPNALNVELARELARANAALRETGSAFHYVEKVEKRGGVWSHTLTDMRVNVNLDTAPAEDDIDLDIPSAEPERLAPHEMHGRAGRPERRG